MLRVKETLQLKAFNLLNVKQIKAPIRSLQWNASFADGSGKQYPSLINFKDKLFVKIGNRLLVISN